jgi:hypothetical protein
MIPLSLTLHQLISPFVPQLINPVLWGIAFIHIALVMVYASARKWGNMSGNNPIALPGGAVPLSFPLWEIVAVFWFTMHQSSFADAVIAILAGHMLKVRLILLIVSLCLAWNPSSGTVICMDHRTWQTWHLLPKRSLANHTGACGGFDGLTLWGLFPSVVILAFLRIDGVAIPNAIVWLALIPWILIGAKQFKLEFFQILSDVFQVSEIPGWLFACLYTWRRPQYQRCEYH